MRFYSCLDVGRLLYHIFSQSVSSGGFFWRGVFSSVFTFFALNYFFGAREVFGCVVCFERKGEGTKRRKAVRVDIVGFGSRDGMAMEWYFFFVSTEGKGTMR